MDAGFLKKYQSVDISPLVLWHCWLCDRKGIRPGKDLAPAVIPVVLPWKTFEGPA